jgi:carboxyl-terminal processing protease
MAHVVMRYKRFLVPVLAVAAGLALWAGCQTAKTPPAPPLTTSLKPGPNDPRIAFWTARLLEEYHYRQRPLDRELSEKFFDGYINSLDPRHENFLQSDLDEFSSFRTNLDTLTLGGRGAADLSPAFLIYDRYASRFQQHNNYANELLRQDHFKFTADEKIQLDRRHAPFPKDLDEAKQLWRQHLRYDFLQEKLAREISETNGLIVVKLSSTNAADIGPTLTRHYRWGERMMTNLDSDAVLQIYLNALAHAYDPHSDFFTAPHAQDFAISMNLGLFGIGAQLHEDDGYCTIMSLVKGGPAEKSKQLKEGDRIVAVAQGDQPAVNVVDMELEKVVQQIRGAKGTEVRLTLSPAADRTARRVISLVRDEIKIEDSEAKAKLVELPDGHGGTNRIGVIDLPSFYFPVDMGSANHTTPKYTSVDVAKLIRKLKQEKVSGIIIDLRTNPGGSLEEAIKFTGLFIKDGPVVLARDPDGHVQMDSVPGPMQLYDGPLVVMINRFSASASEIAAAALQDYGRALIVGDVSTHGKGTVQNINPLRPFVRPATATATNDPGQIKITIRKFYRISGASTQLKGVEPDIVLPSVLNYSTQIGETSLENPLPWDTIQPVNYEKLNLVRPYLPLLRAADEARIATNQEFSYVQQDIAQFQKSQADKTAPLNERDAIKEHQRVATQNHTREQEREHRPLPDETVYELTVKNSTEPGLPEPKPFFTTNYNFNSVAYAVDKFKASSPLVLVDTNFYTDYLPGFTDYFQTNYANLADAKFVFTNFPDTNIFAKIINPLTGTNQIVKPVVTKTYSPDPALEETERILVDYISLLSKNGAITVVR